MRAAAWWGLASALLGVLACTGPRGPEGPPGPTGPTGPAGPQGPANLTGGTVVGDLFVTGELSAAGRRLTWPSNPMLMAGIAPQGCATPASQSGTLGLSNGMAIFPTRFPPGTSPVVIALVDESGDANGASWVNLHRIAPNRVSFRCDLAADAIHWLAIEPGHHQIDGKQVEAGTSPSGSTAVSFQGPFPRPPVILLTIDGVGTFSNRVRIRGTPDSGGFQYELNGNPGTVHWIAMEDGDYTYGRYHWKAGILQTNNTCSSCTIDALGGSLTTAPAAFLTVDDVDSNGANSARLTLAGVTGVRFELNATTEDVDYVVLEDLP